MKRRKFEDIPLDIESEIDDIAEESNDDFNSSDNSVITYANEPKSAEISPEMRKDRWKNRRKMAWISLFSILGVVIFLIASSLFGILSVEAIGALTPIIQLLIGTLGGIIGAYIGFATLQYNNEDKNRVQL